MRKTLMHLVVGSLLILGTTACADLDVVNFNDPDAARSLATPGDVLSLIGGTYNTWFYGNYSYYSAGLALSNAAFQHTAPWANSGMEKYGRIPRIAFINSISDTDYNYMTRSWFYSYRAIAAVADGLKSLERDEIKSTLTADEIASAKAFGKFVQGMAHATIAVLFSQGFVVDETTDLTQPQEPSTYTELMAKAGEYFDAAATASRGTNWSLPAGWMTVAVTGPELAKIAKSMKARYEAAVARTPAERAALNWTGIMADVDAGITSDVMQYWDMDNGWYNDVLDTGTDMGWSQLCYFIFGMADQSGNFQTWNAASLTNKSYIIGGKDILIVTPDLRFPQGTTIAAQRLAPTTYFRVNRPDEAGATWARPDRGTWRWSWYKFNRGGEYYVDLIWDQPEIRLSEMRLLKAEGLYRTGNKAGAAAIINETRVAAGLNATDAAGTNTSCVPKLPGPGQGADTAPGNNQCGGLFEMLKWEKRMENTHKGPLGNLWFFDGRGWGDLWKDTFLQLPMPCSEAQVLQLLPCESFGGPGGQGGAALSTYKWNGES